MSTFGDRLRASRKKLGMTQNDISKIIGVAESSYCAYEKNNREPNFDLTIKMANALGVSTDFLLGRTEEHNGTVSAPPTDDRVLRYLEALDVKMDKLAAELAELRTSNEQIGELVRRVEDSEIDIRILKKLAAKE
ncbi:hypothetical protein CIG75_19265 [Tumebacillus algifaecis]|uniref:HTH cro/C1-type domain-containing protein n=1 Tax=Tumebacillus algifaecis TaxID=1214604 RepID=A0A223D672_9BACL|nr:helix-turn-helix domain-containing protein [Tumebacillus algifaecis]ASS76874.1 hypothetical protein CIG75_19265 [Tumebacillus algifaecis]